MYIYLNSHIVYYLGKLAMTTLCLRQNTNATLGDNRYFYTWRTNDEPRNLLMYIHSSPSRWEIYSVKDKFNIAPLCAQSSSH